MVIGRAVEALWILIYLQKDATYTRVVLRSLLVNTPDSTPHVGSDIDFVLNLGLGEYLFWRRMALYLQSSDKKQV